MCADCSRARRAHQVLREVEDHREVDRDSEDRQLGVLPARQAVAISPESAGEFWAWALLPYIVYSKSPSDLKFSSYSTNHPNPIAGSSSELKSPISLQ